LDDDSVMGLNYGFDIFCDRSKLCNFIDSVIELAGADVGHSTTITFGDQQKVVPLFLSYDRNTYAADDPQNDDGFRLAIPFAVDDDIRDYLQETRDYFLRQNPDSKPYEPEIDDQGRVRIGCIYFYIVTDLDAIGRTGYDADLVGFEFRAATNDMSRLFQRSQSIRQTFVELAKKQGAVYCMFSSGASDKARVLWLDGREYDIAIPDDWLAMSQVRHIVSLSSSS
jgi:hypothetical protein